MNDDDRLIRELYSESTTRPRTDHPDEATWEAMALGELPEERRQGVLDHVSRCAECAQVYRGLKMLVAEAAIFDAGVPRSASRRPLQWPNRWVYGGLAAAAALLLMLRPIPHSGTSPPGPTLTARSDDPLRSSAASAPVPVEPTGTLEGAPRAFRWQAMAGRSRYRIELFSRTGDLLWASPPVEGTIVDWPSSVPRAAGRYYWQIIALADPSRPLTAPASSPLVSFDFATP
jgi:hypothetical protein